MRISKIVYFDSAESQNTDKTLELAKERAEALRINDIVVASSTGATGVKASVVFKGFNLVVVGSVFKKMEKENKDKLTAAGVKVFTASHVLSGVERAIRRKWNTLGTLEIMSHCLRLFGEGTKVCLEIATMAVDSGFTSADKDIIAISGTSGGADTALVIRPAHAHNFFDSFVKEIIAKPRERGLDGSAD